MHRIGNDNGNGLGLVLRLGTDKMRQLSLAACRSLANTPESAHLPLPRVAEACAGTGLDTRWL